MRIVGKREPDFVFLALTGCAGQKMADAASVTLLAPPRVGITLLDFTRCILAAVLEQFEGYFKRQNGTI